MADPNASGGTLGDEQGHVDVGRAEAIFHELDRELTRRSEVYDGNRTRTASPTRAHDLEKLGEEEGEGRFNLRDFLQSSNDANQNAGIKHKHVGVTWDDLEVDVIGGADFKIYMAATINFFLFPILYVWRFILSMLHVKSAQLPTRTILHKQSGVLKPGEMCLVLGCPGAGCTTFLKAIANERHEYARVGGDVRYAGIDAAEMAKTYKGEVAYNEEDDRHIPTLTVGQTLNFALSTKTPGPNGRLPGLSRAEFNEKVENMLLQMLNISHTKQTYVGDEFVRGVSGGERKRVSIAEMMATRAHVLCFDNSTRGLDASTALDFIKAMRAMTDILGQTTFATLYQAGEGIYELFDKVIVLDKGRQVFFGPPSEARAYFENIGYKPLPRQSTADYLTGCTDPNERQFAPARSSADVPSSPGALEETFRNSSYANEMQLSLEKYKVAMETQHHDQLTFREAVAAEKKRGVSKKSPYTVGFFGQVKALVKRNFQMRMQDKFQLITSYTLDTVLALVIGGAYFNQPLDSAGAFTRGSVMFAALLTSCLETFSELPAQMLGRPILKKQTSYSFYRPAATVIANTLADMPFSFIRITIYNIIIYFMVNLNRNGGAFFAWELVSYLAFLTMQGFFRTFGLMCSNFDTAFRLSVFFIPNMVQYIGYMIPVQQMKRWLFWIYYINPLGYAFSGVIENEFHRITFECDGSYVVPRNLPGVDKYPDTLGANQACTLFGSQPGSMTVTGADYLKSGYSLDVADQWRRNFVVLLGFFIAFQVTQLLLIEFFPQYHGHAGTIIYAKPTQKSKELNSKLAERKATRGKLGAEAMDDLEQGVVKVETSGPAPHRRTFTWEAINYTVPVPGGERRLLHDVYGYVKPGTLTALMGSSGAGKTTCLDVLAQRKNIGVISGSMLVDGRPIGSDFARGTAYAEQMDVHEGTATVREAMQFSARLRQPAHVPMEEKDAYVEEILELLELQDLADALVFSLGVEARKRLTIGVELASKPELLLFLDEPTSGLDGQSAWNLVRFLKKLAASGQAILCTIHQPSSLLFESFDRLLLLEKGGETVYFGDIGDDSSILQEYFARYGALCPSNVNPAEYMLDAIGAGLAPRVGDRDWADIWRDSPEYKVMRQEIEDIKQQGLALPVPEKNSETTYATPFWVQLKEVVRRNNLALWRSPDYVFTRLFIHAFISVQISLCFLQLGTSSHDLQYRVFGMFWATILPMILMSQIEPLWIFNRRIFIRESSSRIYSPYVFAIGQLVGEIPYSILCAFVYWVLMVWPMGYGQGSAGTNGNGFLFLVILFVEFFGVTLGQFIGAVSPNIQTAALFNPFIGLILTTFCGVTIPYPTMESFWRSWLYQLDPYTRVMSAMLATELHGLRITCQADEFSIFSPPSGQTCFEWANDFVTVAGGYLDNPNATEHCRYCQYEFGDQFTTPLNIEYSNRWRDVWIVFCYFIFNFIITIIASRLLRYAKR
ncbi:ABC-2 type transporter-domain-containing protein [Irpex rosettiformis]|uniref:ABC-2 type transporter-domain-containing protein n=1 Tax=Irpex rosettiformis TaxID=378272 RepID=A0ACB8UNL5_9APHY|nr:ABC-2 type transporter-domain-containing protein [Irpex rosettiformis]